MEKIKIIPLPFSITLHKFLHFSSQFPVVRASRLDRGTESHILKVQAGAERSLMNKASKHGGTGQGRHASLGLGHHYNFQ